MCLTAMCLTAINNLSDCYQQYDCGNYWSFIKILITNNEGDTSFILITMSTRNRLEIRFDPEFWLLFDVLVRFTNNFPTWTDQYFIF